MIFSSSLSFVSILSPSSLLSYIFSLLSFLIPLFISSIEKQPKLNNHVHLFICIFNVHSQIFILQPTQQIQDQKVGKNSNNLKQSWNCVYRTKIRTLMLLLLLLLWWWCRCCADVVVVVRVIMNGEWLFDVWIIFKIC